MAKVNQRAYRKVGRVYSSFEGTALLEYRCDDGEIHCCHFPCRMRELRAAGYHDIADRLEGNAAARDYRHNWGKLILDDGTTYWKRGDRTIGGPERRKAMAQYMRAMRDNHKTDSAPIIVSGCWQGALMPK